MHAISHIFIAAAVTTANVQLLFQITKYREMHCPNIAFSKILTADASGVKELEFQCEDGFLYFKADAYTNVDILLSPKKLDKIMSTFLYDNDYTEIKFCPVELK